MGGNPVPLDCVREATMWARIRETLADWYILIFAICLIAGGMFAASHQAAAPTTTQQSTTQTHRSIADKCRDVAAATTGTIRATARTIPAFGTTNASESGRFARSFCSPARQQRSRQADSSACVARSWHAHN